MGIQKVISRKFVYVIDNDAAFAESLKINAHIDGPVPLGISNLKEAEKKLSTQSSSLLGIFINISMGAPGWIQLVRTAHLHQPGKPTFIFANNHLAITAEQIKEIGALGPLFKPLTFKQMLDHIQSAGPEATFQETKLQFTKSDGPSHKSDEIVDDNEFLPLARGNLCAGAQTTFNIYVKLSPGHYVKVARRGDVISQKQMENYLDKKEGASLYILKMDQERYVKHCDAAMDRLLNDPQATLKNKVDLSLSHGGEILSFLKTSGISPENLNHAYKYLDQTKNIVGQLLKGHTEISGYLSDLRSFDHSVGVCLIGSMLITSIGVESRHIYHSIGIALMLHDIALFGKPDVFYDEDESKMNDTERALFRLHPYEGARLLEKIPEIPDSVLDAIEQHHMRLNGGGFPQRPMTGQVNRIGEVIGISDEFVKLIRTKQNKTGFNPVTEMKTKIFPGFSSAICKAFEKVFP